MKALFEGGTEDGKMLEVSSLARYVVVPMPDPDWATVEDFAFIDVSEIYNPKPKRGTKQIYKAQVRDDSVVYVLDRLEDF